MRAEKKIELIQLFRNNLKLFTNNINDTSKKNNIKIMTEEQAEKEKKNSGYNYFKNIDKYMNKNKIEHPVKPATSVKNNTGKEEENKIEKNNTGKEEENKIEKNNTGKEEENKIEKNDKGGISENGLNYLNKNLDESFNSFKEKLNIKKDGTDQKEEENKTDQKEEENKTDQEEARLTKNENELANNTVNQLHVKSVNGEKNFVNLINDNKLDKSTKIKQILDNYEDIDDSQKKLLEKNLSNILSTTDINSSSKSYIINQEIDKARKGVLTSYDTADLLFRSLGFKDETAKINRILSNSNSNEENKLKEILSISPELDPTTIEQIKPTLLAIITSKNKNNDQKIQEINNLIYPDPNPDPNANPNPDDDIDYSVLSALANAKPKPYDLKFEEARAKLLEKYGNNEKATNVINKLANNLINQKPNATGGDLLDTFNIYQQKRTNLNTKTKGYQVNEIGDLVQIELDGIKHDINTGKNTNSNSQPQSQPSTISIPGDPNIIPSAGVPQGYKVQEYDESSGQWIFAKQDSNSSDNSSNNTSSDSDNKGALNVRIKTVRNEDGTFTTTFYNPKTNMISEYIGTVDENGQLKDNEFKSSVHVLDTKYKDSEAVIRANEEYDQYKADQEAINNTPENLQKQGQYAANRANKSQEGFRIINDDSFKTWQKEQSKKLNEYKKQVGLRRTSAAVGAIVGALLNHKRRMDKWKAQAQWAIYNHKPIPRQPSILLSYLGGGVSGAAAGFVGGSILKTTGLGKTLDSTVRRLGLENNVKGNEDEYKELNKNTNIVRDAYYKQANDKARELIKNIISNTPENKSTLTRNIKNSQDRDYLLSALETDAGKQYIASLLGIKGSIPSASELWYRLTGSYNVPNWYRNSSGKIRRFKEGRSRKEFFFSKSSIPEDTLELYNISYYLYRCFSNIETGVNRHSDKFENILALYSAVNSLPKYQDLDLVLFSEEYLIHGRSYKNFLEKELSVKYLDFSENYRIPEHINKFYTNYSEAFPYGMSKSEFVSKVLFNDCFKPYILDKLKYKSIIDRANKLVLFNDFNKKKPDSVIISDDSIDDIKIQQNNGQEDKQTATNLTQQDLNSQKQTITQNQNQLDKQKRQQERLNEVKNVTNNNINDIQDNAKIKEQEIKDKLNNIIKEINAANIQGDDEKANKLKDKLQNFRLKIQDIKNNRENKVQEQKDRYESEKQKIDNNKINGVQNFSNINKEKAQEIALNYFKTIIYADLMEFNKKGRDGKFKILKTLKLTDKDLSMFSKWYEGLQINISKYLSGPNIHVIIKNKYMNKDYNNNIEQFNIILDKDYNIKYSYCSVNKY